MKFHHDQIIAGVRINEPRSRVIYIRERSDSDFFPVIVTGGIFMAPTREGGFSRIPLFVHRSFKGKGWTVSYEGFSILGHGQSSKKLAILSALSLASSRGKTEWEQALHHNRRTIGLTAR